MKYHTTCYGYFWPWVMVSLTWHSGWWWSTPFCEAAWVVMPPPPQRRCDSNLFPRTTTTTISRSLRPRSWRLLSAHNTQSSPSSSSQQQPSQMQPKDDENNKNNVQPPDFIQHSVLKAVYPTMMEYYATYGHPNIPLGCLAGRQCEQLRRLAIQQKLSPNEIAWLESIAFRFHTLEQVYETADFHELYQRLVQYKADNDGDVSPPKKYKPDPELGAWVTGIRRKGPENVDPQHKTLLDAIGFQWVSPRACGSQFMNQYRDILARLEQEKEQAGGTSSSAVWNDVTVQKWIRSQQEAARRGTLSETRRHYLETMLHHNKDWVEQERPWEVVSLE